MPSLLDSAVFHLAHLVPAGSFAAVPFAMSIFRDLQLPSRLEIDPQTGRCALVACIGIPREDGLVLAGRLDYSRTDPFVLAEDKGVYHGRGVATGLGFVSCLLSMVPHWNAEKLPRPIYIALTSDHTTGAETVHSAIDLLKEWPRASSVIIGAPTEMNPAFLTADLPEAYIAAKKASLPTCRNVQIVPDKEAKAYIKAGYSVAQCGPGSAKSNEAGEYVTKKQMARCIQFLSQLAP